MQKLYELQSGSLYRRNAEGVYEDHEAPYTFVPSPGEHAGNKFRLKEVGEVADDSPEVVAAMNNTNFLDHPNAFKTSSKAKVTALDDITAVRETKAALDIVAAANDEATLDKYIEQESSNPSRIRKVIIQAIEARRKELKPASTATIS